jgi:hypothetical protein
VDAMQSSNTGLQFYANEFVYLLCNESAGAFTRFVGFGPAAGHLAVRGLMNMGSVKGKERKREREREKEIFFFVLVKFCLMSLYYSHSLCCF